MPREGQSRVERPGTPTNARPSYLVKPAQLTRPDLVSCTFPYISARSLPWAGRMIARVQALGAVNYLGGGICVQVGTGTAVSFAGWFNWATNCSVWNNGSGEPYLSAITQSQWVWEMIEFSGPMCEFYVSFSTSDTPPTEKGTDSSSQWVRAAYVQLVPAGTTGGQALDWVRGLYAATVVPASTASHTIRAQYMRWVYTY